MNTSIALKKKMWPQFVKMCESQWICGGERYALSSDKEFADLVCEVAGNEWIGGNIVKYTGEIINTNPKPEAAFAKIAVYAFLYWLKEQENIDKTGRDRGEEITT